VKIDISNLKEIGDSLNYSAIQLDSAKVKVVIEKPENLIVKIEAPAKEEAVAAETPAAAETETPTADSNKPDADKTKEKEKESQPSEDQGKAPAANKS